VVTQAALRRLRLGRCPGIRIHAASLSSAAPPSPIPGWRE
jgi:hypothetical protein